MSGHDNKSSALGRAVDCGENNAVRYSAVDCEVGCEFRPGECRVEYFKTEIRGAYLVNSNGRPRTYKFRRRSGRWDWVRTVVELAGRADMAVTRLDICYC
jgi:hypothetical protein